MTVANTASTVGLRAAYGLDDDVGDDRARLVRRHQTGTLAGGVGGRGVRQRRLA